MRFWTNVTVLALCALGSGCGDSSGRARVEADSTDSMAEPAPPTLAQVAHIARAANAGALGGAVLAEVRSQNPDVVRYANTVLADQAAIDSLFAAAIGEQAVQPVEHPLSRGFSRSSSEARTRLGRLTGQAFDSAFLEHEIAYHEAMLGVLDRSLLPRAGDAEIATVLRNVRPAVEAHLRRARQLAIEVDDPTSLPVLEPASVAPDSGAIAR